MSPAKPCRRGRIAGPLIAAIACAGSPAAAQSRPADELFRKGREAAKAADWPRALALFEESQRLDPAPGTLLNIAETEYRLGRLASALERFERVLGQLANNDPRVAVAKKRAAELRARVPRLRVFVSPASPPGTVVHLDDAPLAPDGLGRGLPVDPGRHVVSASAPGGRAQRVEVVLAEGETKSVVADASTREPAASPRQSAAEPAEEADADAAGPSPWRTVGYVAGGVGLASVGVGVATGLVALGKKSELEDACPVRAQCTPEGVDTARAGSTFATISTVTFAAGLAAVGVGTTLLLVSPRSSGALGVSAAAAAAPSGGGVVLRGTW